LVGGLVCASMLLAGPALAATVRLAPEPGTSNTASFTADNPSFPGQTVPYQNVEVVGSSTIVAAFDAVTRVLRFDSISLQHGNPVVPGFGTGFCLRQMMFRLPEGSLPPQAAVDVNGHFAMSFAVVMDYLGSDEFHCLSFHAASLTATWNVTGTLTIDTLSGRTRLSDMTVNVGNSSDSGTLRGGTLTLNLWDGFGLTEAPKYQQVGDVIKLAGNDITPGSILKVYVNTPRGPRDMVPDGLAPTAATTPTTWEGVLPFPWPASAPDDFELGYGFMQVFLVRTDRGFDRSNGIARALIGNSRLGVPSIRAIGDSPGLAASSWSPEVAVANVEDVFVPGTSYYIDTGVIVSDAVGDVDQDPVVNIFSAAGNCAPQGGLPPNSSGATFIQITIPAACPVGPGAFQVVNRNNGRASNIVSAPLGALIDIDTVTVQSAGVTVTGAGFSTLTVLNLFATQKSTGNVVNFGGPLPSGQPRIALTSVTPTSLTFQLPSEAAAGAAFVEALNPPFIPFTSSRSRLPGGAFTIP
jgi:hypothetical protein